VGAHEPPSSAAEGLRRGREFYPVIGLVAFSVPSGSGVFEPNASGFLAALMANLMTSRLSGGGDDPERLYLPSPCPGARGAPLMGPLVVRLAGGLKAGALALAHAPNRSGHSCA
jgi:hypothetical protein